MQDNTRKKLALILGAACLLLAALCWVFRPLFTDAPFSTAYAFDGPSGVFPGESGRLYIIDQGKKTVLITDGQGKLLRSIDCGTDGDSEPYYASLVAEGADGSIYVADTRYAGQGTRISQERIFRYDANGENGVCIYLIDYETIEQEAPLQYGNILSLREENGALVFTRKTDNGLAVCQLDLASGRLQSAGYDLPGQYISDADAEPGTLRPIFTNRLGQVCTVTDGATEVLLDEGRTSWMLCAEEGRIYYSDIAANAVLCYDLETGREEIVLEAPDILYGVQTAGGRLYTTDYMGYYMLEDGEASYVDALTYSQPLLRCALWAALFLGGLLAVAVAYLLLAPALHRPKSELFQRMAIVLGVSLCMGCLVGYITITQMVSNQKATVMEQLNLFCDILVENTDTEALANIDSLADYKGADFNQVKEPLDALTRMGYENGMYYYYAIYSTDGEVIYTIMDFEETLPARYPVYAYGEEGYTEVLAEGESVEFGGDVSSYGSWAFVLKPIRDAAGTPIAIMEVGTNLDDLDSQIQELVKEVALTILSMAVVLLMIIVEIIFYAEHRERKRKNLALPGLAAQFPLRLLIFLAYLVDCMQDAFVSILANQLYTPILGIPQSVGAALPLSAQVFAAAVMAFLGGGLSRKAGVKKTLVGGFLLEITGCLLCGAGGTYFSLLGGKAVIGMGLGLIIVSLNAIAARGEDEAESAKAFTDISAGTLAGVTAGAGVGSIILSFGHYSMVYFAGAAILLIGLALSFSGRDYKEAAVAKVKEEVGFFRFLFNRQVITFLLLMLLPFLMGLSFREYFFPIYAAELGMSETMIGRLYLICGLLVIYAGPQLTGKLIARLGGKWTVALASGLIIAAPLLYVAIPTLATTIVGVLLLSVAISFGYAAQSTYYSELPSVEHYGGGRAMGIYSLFENIGQTIGPMIYGLAMMLGYRSGLGLIGGAMLALLLLFLACNGKKKRFLIRQRTGEKRKP
ncbi:MAG TPA: MFS transporter [Candidatus Pelethousia gallinarum]|nr:MFS transporter [Candidatus Pelethousia gallinarum]